MSTRISFHVKEFDKEAWPKLRRALRQLTRAPHAKVGIVGAQAQADHGTISLVELAATHELGSPARGIPERSFIRAGLEEHLADYAALLGPLLQQFLEGKVSLRRLLGILGQKGAADVKAKIVGGPPLTPPLAPATLALKKKKAKQGAQTKGGKLRDSSGQRPLVETGQLVASISYEVELSRDGGGATP